MHSKVFVSIFATAIISVIAIALVGVFVWFNTQYVPPSDQVVANVNENTNTTVANVNTNTVTNENTNQISLTNITVNVSNTNGSTVRGYLIDDLVADYEANSLRIGDFSVVAVIVGTRTDAILVGAEAGATRTIPMTTESPEEYEIGQMYIITFRTTNAEGEPELLSAYIPMDGYNR